MINKLQRLLYALGVIAPILMITSIIYLIRGCTISTKTVLILLASIAIVIYHYWFLWYSKRNLGRIVFTPDTVPEEADKKVFELVATYVIPFVDWIPESKNISIEPWLISAVVCTVLIIVIVSTNNTIPSPWYRLIGYHFHRVESAGKKYTIISKEKNYRNKARINSIKRLFDDLLVIEK